MTRDAIFRLALEQSARDSNCRPEDFLRAENVIVESAANGDARRYLELPFACDLTSYGENIVASVAPQLRETVTEYVNRFPAHACFETPNLHVLMDALRPHGLNACFMAEYWLPDPNALCALECPYETRILQCADFQALYRPEWSNALCEKRRELDVLAVGAYDNGRLIGLAGGSADCRTMWQIGVDVLPGYRRQGVASALTSRLALEILAREKAPFYCCAWSNVRSARNAIRSGFRPAWVQLTARPEAQIAELNEK